MPAYHPFIILWALVTQLTRAANLANLILNAGVTITASSKLTTTEDVNLIKTFNGESLMSSGQCFSTASQLGANIRIDFGTTQSIGTVLIITGGNTDGTGFQSMYKSSLYIGNSAINSSNLECAKDIGETGFYQCKGSGRYLYLQTTVLTSIKICHMAVYSEYNFVDLAYSYVLPTGIQENTLNRRQPIGFKLGPGIRNFSTTILAPGQQWQADWFVSRGTGVIVLAGVPTGGQYSVFSDPVGDGSMLCGVGTQPLETIACSSQRFMTLKNTGTVDIEVYGLAALDPQANCSCNSFQWFGSTIDTYQATYYRLGSPALYLNTLFGNCFSSLCPVTYGFLINNQSDVAHLNTFPIFYGDYFLMVETSDNSFIGTYDVQVTQKLNSDLTKVQVINHFIITIVKGSHPCNVTALTLSSSSTLAKQTFQIGGTAINAVFPVITESPDCAYWLDFSFDDATLAQKGFSFAETPNATFDSTKASTRGMFDYSLKFTTTDASLVGDYSVKVNVLIKDTPKPPYSSVTPPLQLTVPVSVRNCSISANPATIANLSVKVTQTFAMPLTFTAVGQLCGAVTLTRTVLKGTTTVNPAFVTYDQAKGEFKVANPTSTDIATYTIKFTVTLVEVPITPFFYSFPLTISVFTPLIVDLAQSRSGSASSILTGTSNGVNLATAIFNGIIMVSQNSCMQSNTESTPWIYVDLGSSKSIKTVLVIAGGNADGTGFDSLAMSELSVGGLLRSNNVICNGNVSGTGFYDCNGTGQYLWLAQISTGQLQVCKIAAFSYYNIADLGVSYSSTASNAAILGRKFPSQIKVANGIQDRTTVVLDAQTQPAYWRAQFGLSYQIVGVAVVIKTGSTIKAYVTATTTYSSDNVCHLDTTFSSNVSMITCDMPGQYVWVVATAGIVEIYQVAIFKTSTNCVSCATDFKFIPALQSITLQPYVIGSYTQIDSLLYGSCPELNCAVSITQTNPQFLPTFFTNKYVLTGATNSQIGTYQTSVYVTLTTNPTQYLDIKTMTKVVMSNSCQVTSLTTSHSLVLNPLQFQIGVGAAPTSVTLPTSFVQMPACGIPVTYAIITPDSSLSLKPQQNGSTILEVSEQDPLKARTFTAQLQTGLSGATAPADSPIFSVQITLTFDRFKNQLQGLTPQFSSLESGSPSPITQDYQGASCLQTKSEVEPKIMIDMGASLDIITISYIQSPTQAYQTQLSVLIGDDPNVLGLVCQENVTGSGYYPCKGSGRYLFFKRTTPGQISVCYLGAYKEANVADLAVSYAASPGSMEPHVAAQTLSVLVQGKPPSVLEAPSPYWSADFAISRTIFGISVIATDQNNNNVSATIFVSNSLAPSSSDQCISFELNFQQHITCNKSGQYLIVQFKQANTRINLYSIAVFEKQSGCLSCATDFHFIPDQTSLTIIELFVGQRQVQKSLSYARCPALECEVTQQLTLQSSQSLAYSQTLNGLSWSSVGTNHDLGTYTYSLKATLVADPSKVWNVSKLNVLLSSSGCAFGVAQPFQLVQYDYFIGISGQKSLTFNSANFQHILGCGYYLEYELTSSSITSVVIDIPKPQYDQLPTLLINEADLTKKGEITVMIRVKAAILDYTQQYLPFTLENAIQQPISFKDCNFKPISAASITYYLQDPPATLPLDFAMVSAGCGAVTVSFQSTIATYDMSLKQLSVVTQDIALINTTQTLVIQALNQFQRSTNVQVSITIAANAKRVPNVLAAASFASSALSNGNQISLPTFFTQGYLGETLTSQAKCISTATTTKPYIMINLGQTRSIKTVHIVAAGNPDGTGFTNIATSFIYVGNDGTTPEKNQLCNSQITDSGIYSCIATGTYMFLQLQRSGSINICHFAAHEYFNVAHYGVSYSTSDPKSTAQMLGIEKPLAIKISPGVRDQNTVTLNPSDNASPFWQVNFGNPRSIQGVIAVMKVLQPSSTEGIKVYVTNGEPPSLSTVCNVNILSTESYVNVLCLLTGTTVLIVGQGTSAIELYQVGILVNDANCSACNTDFQFGPDLPSLVVQTIKAGDPILHKPLLYGTCPQLACQVTQTFLPINQQLKTPFSVTNTGIQFQSLTNQDIGTYEYKYTAFLTSLARRLNVLPKPSLTISILRVVVVSDGCQVTSLAVQPDQEVVNKSYHIGSGKMQILLPTAVQTPSCGYSLQYQFQTTPQLSYSLQKQSSGEYRVEVEITDYQLANQIVENTVQAFVVSTPSPPYQDYQAKIRLMIQLLDCRLEPTVKTLPDASIKVTSDVVMIEESFVSVSSGVLCGDLQVSFSAFQKENQLIYSLSGVTYDLSASRIKLYSYKSQDIGNYEVTVTAKYSAQFSTQVKFNLQIQAHTLDSQNGKVGILLPGGIFIPLGPQPIVTPTPSLLPTNSTVIVPATNSTVTNSTVAVTTILDIISKLNLPRDVLENDLLPLYPQYQAVLDKEESQRTKPEKDLYNRFQYLLSDDSDYVNGNGKKFALPEQESKTNPLTASVGDISIVGIFRIKFSAPVFIIKPDVLKQKKRFDVKVEWKNEMYLEDPKSAPLFLWKVVNITESFVDVNITFSEPLLISQGPHPDQIKISFANRYYFRRQSDGEPLADNSLIIIKDLPQQMPSLKEYEKIAVVESRIKSIRDSTGVVLLVCIIMNLPKSLFWSLHSTIQFMSMEPEHGAKMPANAAFVFKQIKEITELKLIPTQKLIEKLKWLNKLAKNANAFWHAGFFLMLIFAVALAILLLALLQKLFDHCEVDCKIHKLIIDKVRKKLMFSTMIRAGQLGYMYYTVTALKGIVTKNYSANLTNPKLIRFNQAIYWGIVVFALVYPFAVTGFLQWQGPNGLKKAGIKDKFGSWYMLIDVRSRLKISHTTVFLARRLIVGVSIALLIEYYNFQLIIILVSSFCVSVYNALVRPFVTPMLNNLETTNELVVLLSISLMHSFSDAVESETKRYKVGWVYVWVIFSTLILNLIFIGSYIVEQLYKYLRKEYYTRCYKKKLPAGVEQGLQRLKAFNEKLTRKKSQKQQEQMLEQGANLMLGNFEIDNPNKSNPEASYVSSFKSDKSLLKEIEEEEEEGSFNSSSESPVRGVPDQSLLLVPQAQSDQSVEDSSRSMLPQVKHGLVLDAIMEHRLEMLSNPDVESEPLGIETDNDEHPPAFANDLLTLESPNRIVQIQPVVDHLQTFDKQKETVYQLEQISEISEEELPKESPDASCSRRSKLSEVTKDAKSSQLDSFEFSKPARERQFRNTEYLSKTLKDTLDMPNLINTLVKPIQEKESNQPQIPQAVQVGIDFNPQQPNSIQFSAEDAKLLGVQIESGSAGTSEDFDLLASDNSEVMACISPEKRPNLEDQLVSIASNGPNQDESFKPTIIFREIAPSRMLQISVESGFEEQKQVVYSRPVSIITNKHQRSSSLRYSAMDYQTAFDFEEKGTRNEGQRIAGRSGRSQAKQTQPRQGMGKTMISPNVETVDADYTEEQNANFGQTRDPLNMTNTNMSIGSRTGMYIMSGTHIPLAPCTQHNSRKNSIASGHEVFDTKHEVVSPHSSDQSESVRIKEYLMKQFKKNTASKATQKTKLADKLNDEIASKYILSGITPAKRRATAVGEERRRIKNLQMSLQPNEQAVNQLTNIVSNYLASSLTYAKSKRNSVIFKLAKDAEREEKKK